LYISSGAAWNQIWDGCGCSGQKHELFPGVTYPLTANVPLKMTPDGFNHTKQESPAVAMEDALQPIQLLLQY